MDGHQKIPDGVPEDGRSIESYRYGACFIDAPTA
jgi:hypothetical protein